MQHRWVLLSGLVVALLTASATSVVAQNNCQAFRAVNQARIVLDPQVSLPPVLAAHSNEFGWGGEVYAAIGETGMQKEMAIEWLQGWFYGKDDAVAPIYGKANGRGNGGLYMFAFGTHTDGQWNTPDGFTIQLGQAVWTPNPGRMGTGFYQASGKLVDGTGRFEGATGTFTLQGDFIGFEIPVVPFLASAWNPVLSGNVCK